MRLQRPKITKDRTVTDITQHHAARIDQAHQRLDAHERRITSLETHTAVAEERSKHIQASLSNIQSGITWIQRLVIGGIITAAVAFLLGGGLNVGQ